MICSYSVQLLLQILDGPNGARSPRHALGLGAPETSEEPAPVLRRQGALTRWRQARIEARDLRRALVRLNGLSPHLLDDIGMAEVPGRAPILPRRSSDKAEQPDFASVERFAAE